MSQATDSIAYARQRALRAARAVTLSMLASGCSSAVMPSTQDAMADVAPDVSVAVDSAPDVAPDVSVAVDTAPDAAPDVVADAGEEDADDAGESCAPLRGTDQYIACCERVMWDFRRGCEAWGPFMPPVGEA